MAKSCGAPQLFGLLRVLNSILSTFWPPTKGAIRRAGRVVERFWEAPPAGLQNFKTSEDQSDTFKIPPARKRRKENLRHPDTLGHLSYVKKAHVLRSIRA